MTNDFITYGATDSPKRTLHLILGCDDAHTDLESRARGLLAWLRENVHPETWSECERIVVSECVEPMEVSR